MTDLLYAKNIEYWKTQEVYKTSGCLGTIEDAVLVWNYGVPCLVFRGWIFSETDTITELRFSNQERSFMALPIGMQRADVKDAFGQSKHANQSGFLAVLSDVSFTDLKNGNIQLGFSCGFKTGATVHGTFDSVKVVVELFSDEALDTESLQVLLPRPAGRIPPALIVSPQIVTKEIRNTFQKITEQLDATGISWILFETNIASSSNATSYERITRHALGRYSFVFILKEKAKYLTLQQSPIFIQSPTNSVIECFD